MCVYERERERKRERKREKERERKEWCVCVIERNQRIESSPRLELGGCTCRSKRERARDTEIRRESAGKRDQRVEIIDSTREREKEIAKARKRERSCK